MVDTPTSLDALENEIRRLDRARPMLTKWHWYMERGMPATAHYLDAAKVLHDAAPDLIAKARRVEELEAALREIADLEGEINPSNYDHDDACELNRQFCYGIAVASAALKENTDASSD